MATEQTDLVQRYADFITASPTSYHAAAEVARQLVDAGWQRQDEGEAFSAEPGGHVVVRDGAVIAWRLPEGDALRRGFRIVGSHTDSPSFKLKPLPLHQAAGWQQVGMEVYGGPLLNSWLNRDLGLAGRLVTRSGEVRLVSTGPVAVIPQLAPHLDRTVNDNLSLDKQGNLMPVISSGRPDADPLALLCAEAGIERDELSFFDIHATDTQPPAVVGAERDFFASWRQDNLSSVFASLVAGLEAEGDNILVLAAFDHEEVGSATRTGASGPFLADVLAGIVASLGGDADDLRRMLTRSSCVSADAGHAVNPNYVGKHDPDTHPHLNEGPVLKINGNQRYATDGIGGAMWFRACEAAGVPHQVFVGNNSVPCGSTIGPLTATRLGILTVDVGIPLLSMHSARELSGTSDVAHLAGALGAYLRGA